MSDKKQTPPKAVKPKTTKAVKPKPKHPITTRVIAKGMELPIPVNHVAHRARTSQPGYRFIELFLNLFTFEEKAEWVSCKEILDVMRRVDPDTFDKKTDRDIQSWLIMMQQCGSWPEIFVNQLTRGIPDCFFNQKLFYELTGTYWAPEPNIEPKYFGVSYNSCPISMQFHTGKNFLGIALEDIRSIDTYGLTHSPVRNVHIMTTDTDGYEFALPTVDAEKAKADWDDYKLKLTPVQPAQEQGLPLTKNMVSSDPSVDSAFIRFFVDNYTPDPREYNFKTDEKDLPFVTHESMLERLKATYSGTIIGKAFDHWTNKQLHSVLCRMANARDWGIMSTEGAKARLLGWMLKHPAPQEVEPPTEPGDTVSRKVFEELLSLYIKVIAERSGPIVEIDTNRVSRPAPWAILRPSMVPFTCRKCGGLITIPRELAQHGDVIRVQHDECPSATQEATDTDTLLEYLCEYTRYPEECEGKFLSYRSLLWQLQRHQRDVFGGWDAERLVAAVKGARRDKLPPLIELVFDGIVGLALTKSIV